MCPRRHGECGQKRDDFFHGITSSDLCGDEPRSIGLRCSAAVSTFAEFSTTTSLIRRFTAMHNAAPTSCFIPIVVSHEMLWVWYQAYRGNDAPNGSGQKSLRYTRFRTTAAPSLSVMPGQVPGAFV